MQDSPKPAGEENTGPTSATAVSALMSVVDLAEHLQCSTRHVYRLSDSGKLPRPIKLGSLVRWRRAEVVEWVRAGCPAVRALRGGAGK